MTDQPHRRLTDAELKGRTRELIKAAESISTELMLQTERLAATIDLFNREVVTPLRKTIMTEGEDDRD